MEENDYETRFIREEIGRCEDLDELKARIFPLLQSQHELWMQKMQEILAESGLTKSAFAKRCRVSRVSVDKWCKGAIPKNRETFLRIGMAAEYDLEKMNQLLRRYGQYPELYSKSLEDCVCIYVLNHRFDMDCVDNRESEKGEEAYGLTAYDYILSQIKENMAADADMEIPDINTAQFAERLSQVEDADALTQFIYDNIATFSSAYQKFYAYVKMYVTINYQRYSSSVANLAEGQGWSSSLRQCVSAIRQNKWYPTRNKIISLGLHLSMDHEQIDEMLTMAHMEPLCAKNLFESVDRLYNRHITYLTQTSDIIRIFLTMQLDHVDTSILHERCDHGNIFIHEHTNCRNLRIQCFPELLCLRGTDLPSRIRKYESDQIRFDPICIFDIARLHHAA